MSERKLGEQKLFRIFLHFLDLKFFWYYTDLIEYYFIIMRACIYDTP